MDSEPSLGDDPQRWVEQLDALLAASSPETYAVAAQGLSEGLSAIVRYARIVWAQLGEADGAEREQVKLDLIEKAHEVASALATRALSPEHPLGDDPSGWRQELSRHLEVAAPESYADAVTRGRLEWHLDRVLHEAERAGGSPAIDELKERVLQLATQIFPGPDELIEAVDHERYLSYDMLTELIRIRDASKDDRREHVGERLVAAACRHPDVVSLLDHSVFGHVADDELYLQALAAAAFGRGELEQATERFEELFARFPSVYNGLCLAGCYRNRRLDEQMIALLESLRERFPEDRRAHIALANALFVVGKTRAANDVFAAIRDDYFQGMQSRLDAWAGRRTELSRAMAEGRVYPEETDDVYDDSFAISTWWNYWYHFNAYTKHQHAEGILGEVVPDLIGGFIDDDASDVRTVIDFGVMCGEPLARLARRYPSIRCIGIDRQEALVGLNQRAYPLPNTEFVAGDIFEFLGSAELGSPALLYHVRTAPFLYPAFLRKLYRLCHDARVEFVALIESYSLSLQSRAYVDFEDMDADSEVRGGGLFHHNYVRLLEDSGYRVVRRGHVRNTLLIAGVDSSVFLVARRVDSP